MSRLLSGTGEEICTFVRLRVWVHDNGLTFFEGVLPIGVPVRGAFIEHDGARYEVASIEDHGPHADPKLGDRLVLDGTWVIGTCKAI